MLGQALLISLFGMLVTFCALGLVMISMLILTRLAQDGEENSEENQTYQSSQVVESHGEKEIDLAVPADTPLEEVVAAAIAVAAGRELARQRHSAQVWLSPQPRSLISPWQLAARDRQMDRANK